MLLNKCVPPIHHAWQARFARKVKSFAFLVAFVRVIMKFSAKHGGRLIWKSYSQKQTRQQAFQLSGIFHGANQKFPFHRGPVCQVIRNIILLLNILVHFFAVLWKTRS